MRVLIVIGLLISVAFMVVSVLVGLVCDLSRQSCQAVPDPDNDDWDVEAVNRYRDLRTPAEGNLMSSNALDDLRSAL